MPEFGYNRAINDKLGVGVTVHGNGGMNTNTRVGKSLPVGVDLVRLRQTCFVALAIWVLT